MRRTIVLAFVGVATLAAGWWVWQALGGQAGSSAAAPDISSAREEPTAETTALDAAPIPSAPRTSISSADLSSGAAVGAGAKSAMPGDADARTLVVRVVSKNEHAPLAHVRVSLQPDPHSGGGWQMVSSTSGDLRHAPISDEKGRVEFTLTGDTGYSLWAQGEDDLSGNAHAKTAALAAGEHREIVMELPYGADMRFFGQVVDRESGAPVPNAKVSTMRDGGWTQRGDEEGARVANQVSKSSTDGTGRFDVSVSSWMNPFLRIEAEGFGLKLVQPQPEHDTADHALVVKLSRAATLRALVVDAAGKPLPDATVRLSCNGYELEGRADGEESTGYISAPDEHWRANVAADGRCTIDGLPANVPVQVDIRQKSKLVRRDPVPITFGAGQVLERQWTIGSGARIEGLVVDQRNQPVAKQTVWLLKQEWPGERYVERYESDSITAHTQTNGEGRFVLDDVVAGKWWLAPAPPEYGAESSSDSVAPQTTTIDVQESGTQTVTLRVTRGLFIHGQVLGPDGKPGTQANVTSQQGQSFGGMDANSDPNGAFVLGPLGPGTITLWASAFGLAASSDPVKAEPGQDGVVLQLRPGGLISGTVTDASTGKPSRASLYVMPEHARSSPMGNGFQTDVKDDGVFQLKSLEPGAYSLLFETPDGRFALLPDLVAVADQESKGHVAVLSPGGKLSVRYEGKLDGMQFKVSCQHASRFLDWAPAKQTVIEAVPAGHVIVDFGYERSEGTEFPTTPKHTLTIDVGVGETREVVLHDDG